MSTESNGNRQPEFDAASIQGTPKPQASSTIDRKFESHIYDLDSINLDNLSLDDTAAIGQNLEYCELLRKKLLSMESSAESSALGIDDISLASGAGDAFSKLLKSHMDKDASSMTIEDASNNLKEDSGFSNLLHMSELEREERLCEEKWGLIPPGQYEVNITTDGNSQINPPNFMPTEDSLFASLGVVGSESCILDATSGKHLTSGTIGGNSISLSADVPPQDSSTYQDDDVPSLSQMVLAIEKCSPNASSRKILDEILRAGSTNNYGADNEMEAKLSCGGDSTASRDTSCTSAESQSPNASVLLRNPRACNQYNVEEIDQGVRWEASSSSGEAQSSTTGSVICNSRKLYFTLDENIIWGSVALGLTENKTIHLVNPDDFDMEFLLTIEGDSCFKIVPDLNNDTHHTRIARIRVPRNKMIEAKLIFSPKKLGQFKATLNIEVPKETPKSIVTLCGIGGKSRVIITDLSFDLSKGVNDSLFFLLNPYKGNQGYPIHITNLGDQTGFFYSTMGALDEYIRICPKSGIISPGENASIFILLKNTRHSLLNLLEWSQGTTLIKIGTLKVITGDQTTRLRLKSLHNKYSQSKCIQELSKTYYYLYDDNLFKEENFIMKGSCNIDKMEDTEVHFTLLLKEGVSEHNIDIKIERRLLCVLKDKVYRDHLDRINFYQ